MTSTPRCPIHRPDELWECSSPDISSRRSSSQQQQQTSTRVAGGSTHLLTSHTKNSAKKASTGSLVHPHNASILSAAQAEEFPQIRRAEHSLDTRIDTIASVLTQHEQELLSKEETILALSKEAKSWRKRALEVESELTLVRKEKEALLTQTHLELRDIQNTHVDEVERLTKGKLHAEAELHRILIDLDTATQKLHAATRREREIESQLHSSNNQLAYATAELDMLKKIDGRRNEESSKERSSSKKKLNALRQRFDALDNMCKEMQSERDALERQARTAQLALSQLKSQKDQRLMVDAEELHDKEQQLLHVEEELQAAHITNCRLLRLMCESPDLAALLKYNDVSQDFVFMGYRHEQQQQTLQGVPNGGYVKRYHHGLSAKLGLTSSASGGPTASTGGHFGVLAGGRTTESSTKNARLRSNSQPAPTRGASYEEVERATTLAAAELTIADALDHINGDAMGTPNPNPHALRQLREALLQENEFLHRHQLGSLDELFRDASCDFMTCKQHERFYWVPRAVFTEAQRFKEAYFPKMQLGVFFPFLVRLNEIWRQREAHLLKEAKGRAKAHGAAAASKARRDYEATRNSELERDICMRELEGLAREVRLRVSSKAALTLIQKYEVLCKQQITRRAQAEQKFFGLAEVHNHTLADRAPETIAMQGHLRTLGETVRDLGHHVATKLVAACADVRRFLISVETATNSRGLGTNGQSGYVSHAVLKQLVECIKDFTEEVRRETMITGDSMRRVADAAERTATEIPPVGYSQIQLSTATAKQQQRRGGAPAGKATRSSQPNAHLNVTRDEDTDDDDATSGSSSDEVGDNDDLDMIAEYEARGDGGLYARRNPPRGRTQQQQPHQGDRPTVRFQSSNAVGRGGPAGHRYFENLKDETEIERTVKY